MRGEDHCLLPGEFLDQPSDLDDLKGVETRCRLIEDEDLRVVDQRLGQTRTLPEPLRELADVLLEHRFHPTLLHDPIDARLQTGSGQAPGLSTESQVLVDLHRIVEWVRLGQITDFPPDGDGIFLHIDAINGDSPFGGCDVGSDDFHGGALTRPIGSQEAENLPISDIEGHFVQGPRGAVDLAHVSYLDHRRESSRRTLRCRELSCL